MVTGVVVLVVTCHIVVKTKFGNELPPNIMLILARFVHRYAFWLGAATHPSPELRLPFVLPVC